MSLVSTPFTATAGDTTLSSSPAAAADDQSPRKRRRRRSSLSSSIATAFGHRSHAPSPHSSRRRSHSPRFVVAPPPAALSVANPQDRSYTSLAESASAPSYDSSSKPNSSSSSSLYLHNHATALAPPWRRRSSADAPSSLTPPQDSSPDGTAIDKRPSTAGKGTAAGLSSDKSKGGHAKKDSASRTSRYVRDRKRSASNSTTSPTAARTTRHSPPPASHKDDAVPTLPQIRHVDSDGGSATHRINLPEASPLVHISQPASHSTAAGTRNNTLQVQLHNVPVLGRGLSVESRYSRWGGSHIAGAASRSQENLGGAGLGRSGVAGEEQRRDKSPLLSPSSLSSTSTSSTRFEGSASSVYALRAAPTADLEPRMQEMATSRRRSISSNNTRPHELYRGHDADAGSDRHRMAEHDHADAPRGKDRREQDKKTMLSKALQKAHTAVLLDNAHNFEGAIEAYDDACRLLGQVLIRSAGEDDRRKLDAIRTTYTNRIQELHQINREAAQTSGKNLPARPMSDESLGAHDTPQSHRSLEPEPRQEQHMSNGQSSSATRSSANTVGSQSIQSEVSTSSQPRIIEPPQSYQPIANNALPLRTPESGGELLQAATFQSTERFLTIGSPMDPSYAPPPLSPRRMPQPEEAVAQSNEQLQAPPPAEPAQKHSRANSGNSISWLDTIDESGASSDGSSIHSLREDALHRKHVRAASGDTEAEFDAALDAAVEAAYADGMEPYDYDDEPIIDYNSATVSEPVKQMVDTERKRLSDRSQMIQQAHARTKQITKEGGFHMRQSSRDLFAMSDDAEEEERILEEIQKDFGFDFGLQSKSNAPRQSDSSEYSGASTYHSSMSSSRATASTSLSTVSELQDSLGKPSQNLPRLSEESSQRDSVSLADSQLATHTLSAAANGIGVRSRRMSGQNPKQLKIETSMPPKAKLPAPPPTAPPAAMKMEEAYSAKPLLTAKSDTQLLPDSVFQPNSAAPLTTPLLPPSTLITQSSPPKRTESPLNRDVLPTPTTPATALVGDGGSPRPDLKGGKDTRPSLLNKNKSSISLKTRNMSISSPDGSEMSIGTPLSTSFTSLSNNSRTKLAYTNSAIPPTPSLPNFGENLTQTVSNANIFESDLHSPYVPGSPNPLATNSPIPLEPCPDSHLLRPYWLMRCFYQTIAHPRGGYLSTKLFVPRDVWRVKGVKIKAMEEKIANCDALTQGLLKLNNVDSFDAAAMLEEMQQFESILDTVQSNLSKKLGNEVSVQGIQSLFKDAPSDSSTGGDVPTSGSRAMSQGKSFLSSMRKLRSKSSAVTLSTMPRDAVKGEGNLTLSTLPMTSLANPRFAKRDVSRLEVSGPHAQYMEALAKLCDAVQVIDQIARQVEDPGLKHSSPTHVGLELSTRHASEFFGFYVCRFVMADLTILLDKFIKRGSEWVLV